MEYQAENRKKYFERFLGREPEETPRTGPFTGSPELNVDFSHPKSRKNPAIVRRRADLIGLTNMLIAQGQTGRVDAAFADRGNEYQCPNCGTVVVLKRGRIITPHFAHKPPVNCDWAAGETIAHMKGKRLIAEAFAARKLKVEMEWVVPALPSYRRADVMVWTKSGKQVAIELQHTSIGLDEIEARAFAYANAGIIQTWIPFLPSIVWEDAEKIEEPERRSEYFVRRYSTRPFKKWIHGFNFGHIMYLTPHQISCGRQFSRSTRSFRVEILGMTNGERNRPAQ